MDCIIVPIEEFYKYKTNNVNLKIKEKIQSLPKYESSHKTFTKNYVSKTIPKHLDNFRKVNKCYKRELNSLLNKINEDNYSTIAPKIMMLITTENVEYIIKALLENAYNNYNYMDQIISVLFEIKDTTIYAGDVSFYTMDFYNNFTESFTNILEDIHYLFTSTVYDDFCKLNKKKKCFINYSLSIVKLISKDILEITYDCYFEGLFYKLCEHIDNSVFNEVIMEMIIQLIEYTKSNFYLNKIKVFYTNKISQKFNQKTKFRVKDLFEKNQLLS